MNEAGLNTIIKNSIYRSSWCEKIADSAGGQGTQRCFDGFGTLLGKSLYYETKIQKEYKAFGFASKVEDHQWYNLLKIKKELEAEHFNLIILGVWVARKSFRVFFFETSYLWDLKQAGEKSIKKKQLETLVEKGLYLDIKSEKLENGKRKSFIQDLEKIEDKIIKEGMLE